MVVYTGQKTCYDGAGEDIPCHGSGQDGEYRSGAPWPEPRFDVLGETVLDRLTGLIWTKNANPNSFPVTWREAFENISALNHDHYLGCNDWRLPNRRELRSLMSYQTKNPACQ